MAPRPFLGLTFIGLGLAFIGLGLAAIDGRWVSWRGQRAS
jgi:hypothetical protein